MKLKGLVLPMCAAAMLICVANADRVYGHFGMVIPSTPVVSEQNRPVEIALSFSHPFETIGMDLAKPKSFFLTRDGDHTDLLGDLQPASAPGSTHSLPAPVTPFPPENSPAATTAPLRAL